MCECAIHTPETKHNWFGEKKFRLAHFFDQWWDIYCKDPKVFIQPEQYKAVAIFLTSGGTFTAKTLKRIFNLSSTKQ